MTSILSPTEIATILACIKVHTADPVRAETFAFALKRECPHVYETLLSLRKEHRQASKFPSIDAITAMQCTIFDNWLPFGRSKPKVTRGIRPKGGRRERFQARIEVWTIKPKPPRNGKAVPLTLTETNAQWSAVGYLLDSQALLAKVEMLASPADDATWQGFWNDLRGAAQQIDGCGIRMGPVMTSTAGKHVQPDTYVVARSDDLDAIKLDLNLTLRTPQGDVSFTHWSTNYSNGAPLKDNALMTCRVSSIEQKKRWATKNEVEPRSE